jgi:hypothetical protein
MPLSVKRAIGTTGVLHRAGHLAAFAVTTILFLQWKRHARLHPWLLWPVLTFAFALEWLEAFLFGGAFEWRDVATDIAGLLTALLLYAILRLPWRRS